MSAPIQEWRFEVGEPDAGARLDAFLSRSLSWSSRTRVKSLIAAGRIEIFAGKDPHGVRPTELRPATRLRRGQDVVAWIDAPQVQAGESEPAPTEELRVIHEDDQLVAVSKGAPMNVIPSRRHRSSSLIELVHRRHGELGLAGFPPSPCHRLDRETTGVVLFAKELESRAEIGRQFEERTVEKVYLALVQGCVSEDEGRLDLPLGPDPRSKIELKRAEVALPEGQPASTRWRVRRRLAEATLVELYPETGRQHQLRAHMAALGHPILGDKLYLGGDDLFLASMGRDLSERELALVVLRRQALHAWRLAFVHPATGRPITLEAPLPHDISAFIDGEV